MKDIGIIRKVDSLGRVTIPKELRTIFGMIEHEPVEILGTEKGVFIRNPAIEVKCIERSKNDIVGDEWNVEIDIFIFNEMRHFI